MSVKFDFMSIVIHPFLEPGSGSYSFVVANPESHTCAIIDAALGICPTGNAINTDSADSMLDWIKAHKFVVRWILETHVHADRPSAASYLKSHLLCAQTAIGALTPNISGYDILLREGDKICLDHECGLVLETPGHTPGCVSFQFGDFLFVGDTLFMPDIGTARCDFPGGSAEQLYGSIQRLLALPEETRLFVCHDYGADGKSDNGRSGRRCRFVTTVAEEKAYNVHVGGAAKIEKFVQMRTQRDDTLAAPKWQEVAIPANLNCLPVSAVEKLIATTTQSQSKIARSAEETSISR